MPFHSHCLLFTFTTFVLLRSGTSQDSCEPQNELSRLRKSLLCGYDKSAPPVLSAEEPIDVALNFDVIFMDFIREDQFLQLSAWIITHWKDAYLHWDRQQYHGIDNVWMNAEDIWTPYRSLIAEVGLWRLKSLPPYPCHLYNGGSVYCTFPDVFVAFCSGDLSRWPLDTQTCSLAIGISRAAANSINLGQGDLWKIRFSIKARMAWQLIARDVSLRKSPSRSGSNSSSLRFSYTLRRHSGVHLATVGVPALVLSAMSLLTLLLEAGCPERIYLGCTIALANCIYLQYLGMLLPPSSDKVPAVVLFFRDSLFLTGASLVLAVFLRGAIRSRTPPPPRLTSLVRAVLGTRPGRMLLFSQFSRTDAPATTANPDGAAEGDHECAGGVGRSSPREEETWKITALLMDRISLFLLFIAFSVMLSRYIP